MLVPIPGSDGSYTYDPSVPAPSGGGGGGGGGGDGSFVCNANFVSMDPLRIELDKTYREIITAFETMPVFVCLVMDEGGASIITMIRIKDAAYGDDIGYLMNTDNNMAQQFVADSMDGYPYFAQ